MALPADLFLQAWRPSAYVISGTINWLGMFLVGMLFGYIVVRYLLCTMCYLTRCQMWIRQSISQYFLQTYITPLSLCDISFFI